VTLYVAPDEEALPAVATSTLTQLVTRVCQGRVDESLYSTRVTAWLNEAQGRIARRVEIERLRVRDTLAVTTGDGAYNLPVDYARGLDLIHTDGLDDYPNLKRVPTEDQFDRLPFTTPGRPLRYLVTAGRTYLWPTPDKAYTLRLRYQRLPVLMSGAVVPEIPEDYVDMLVGYAKGKTYQDEDDFELAAKWLADFETTLASLKVDLQETSDDGPVQVEGTF
jgi:hypothetical protein